MVQHLSTNIVHDLLFPTLSYSAVISYSAMAFINDFFVFRSNEVLVYDQNYHFLSYIFRCYFITNAARFFNYITEFSICRCMA